MAGVIRSLLAPRWLAWHGALVVVLVAFTLLGNWQLGSFADADGRQESAAARAAAPVAEVIAPGRRLTGDAVGRTVTATGRFDEATQLLVPGRRLRDRDGFLVLTALRTSEGVLPVNRGWVPDPDDPGTEVPAGEVTVTGVVQPSESESDARVDVLADLPDGQLPYLATVALLDAWPFPGDELFDGYVVLSAQQPSAGSSPALVEPRDLDAGVGKWRNLGYALQWWFFAAAAVFFWWSVIRRSLRERREDEPVAS